MLGIRSLLELRPYFEAAFDGEVIECVLCSEIVFTVRFYCVVHFFDWSKVMKLKIGREMPKREVRDNVTQTL